MMLLLLTIHPPPPHSTHTLHAREVHIPSADSTDRGILNNIYMRRTQRHNLKSLILNIVPYLASDPYTINIWLDNYFFSPFTRSWDGAMRECS